VHARAVRRTRGRGRTQPCSSARRCARLSRATAAAAATAAQDKNPGDDAATAQFAEINNGACVRA
jgi:hypothetical protein